MSDTFNYDVVDDDDDNSNSSSNNNNNNSNLTYLRLQAQNWTRLELDLKAVCARVQLTSE
jgi:hypothetical protein